MPTPLKDVVASPEFQALPASEQRRAASELDPNFKSLPDEFHQDYALTSLAPEPYAFTDRRHNFPPGTMQALEQVESGGQQHPDTAVSPTGVRGRFQITGPTGHEVGLPEELWSNPLANMTAAGLILSKKITQAGDFTGGVKAYGDPKQADYVDRVMRFMPGMQEQPGGFGHALRGRIAQGEQGVEDALHRVWSGQSPAGMGGVQDLATLANPMVNPTGVGLGTLGGAASEATGIGNPDLVDNLTQVLTAVAPSIPRMLGRVFQGARMLSPGARAAEAARPVAQTVTQTPSPVTLFDQYEKPMELATPTSSVRMITPPTAAASPSTPGFMEGKMKAILMSAGGTLMATGHMPSPEHLAIAGGAYGAYKATRAAAKLYDAAMGSPITQRMMEKLLTLGPKDGDFIPLSRALVSAVGGPEALWADDTASPTPSTEGTRR